MRMRRLLAGSVALLLLGACAPARNAVAPQEGQTVAAHSSLPPAAAPHRVDFNAQVRPVLEGRCQPCHFAGGTMYERLPFDQPETIQTLGEKMFTRIQDEQEQALLRSFLAQEAGP